MILISVLIQTQKKSKDKLTISTFINRDDETASEIVMANSLATALENEIDALNDFSKSQSGSAALT